ncbi:MAG: isopeptide-forming domain-containing fimbrial protein [Lachnospiraceae bacterium]|nr:isopeptide-forming domain-containing fimbrial protein [Lachnospiraceae bacterium]
MKKMKKVFAMLLALAMVLGMSMTAFAADEPLSTTNTATASVSNVETGATVYAYRIVEPDYKTESGTITGVKGYKAAADIPETITNPASVTGDEVMNIVKAEGWNAWKETAEKAELRDPDNDGTYTADLKAGSWIVIVVPGEKSQKMYNPILVSNYYTTANSNGAVVEGGEISANNEWELAGGTSVAKSQAVSIGKTIVGTTPVVDGEKGQTEELGDDQKFNDVAVGDIVTFRLKTNIPPYSPAYTDVKVNVKDTLTQGLKLADDPNVVVKLNGTEIEAVGTEGDDNGVKHYTLTAAAGSQTLTLELDSAYALAHPGAEVTVTYDAVLTESAFNYDANENKAELEYTKDTTGGTETTEGSTTKTYTFAFGVGVGGSSKENVEILKKTGTETVNGVTEAVDLDGAKFTLTNDDTERVYNGESADGGKLNFSGLDAGTYTLKEVEAPEGYTLSDKTYKVVITPTYVGDELVEYKVEVGETEDTLEVIADFRLNAADKTITNQVTDPEPWDIPNTKLTSLPSTGGIGTTIFTIAGCLIMVVAAGLFFASRRKSAAK